MKNLLDPEGQLFHLLSRIGDLIILNLLFLVCCVPIVTIGAAQAALYKVTVDMVFEQEGGVLKGFFSAFRSNFRQATAVWLVELVVAVSLVCDALLVITYFPGNPVMPWVLVVLTFLVLCVSAYMIPLVVRYENTLRQHLANAIALAVVKFPRTLAMTVLNALPVLILVLSLQVFVQTLIFWLFIGFGFVAFINSTILKKVYIQLEAGNNKITVGM